MLISRKQTSKQSNKPVRLPQEFYFLYYEYCLSMYAYNIFNCCGLYTNRTDLSTKGILIVLILIDGLWDDVG